jgi:hypothetical protein
VWLRFRHGGKITTGRRAGTGLGPAGGLMPRAPAAASTQAPPGAAPLITC